MLQRNPGLFYILIPDYSGCLGDRPLTRFVVVVVVVVFVVVV